MTTPSKLFPYPRRRTRHCSRIPAAAALAVMLIATACNRTPEGREAEHLEKGKRFLAKKEYRKAVIEFKVAAQNMPKDAEPVYQLGLTYLAAGLGQQAYETFQNALGLNKNHAGAGYQVAQFQVADSRPDVVKQARQVIRGWLATHPLDPEAMGTLALAEAKLGNKDDALQWLQRAGERDPENMRPATSVVAVYTARGDLAAARDVGRMLSEKLPNSPAALTVRAQVSLATRDLPDADEQLGKALQIKRDFQPALQVRLRRELLNKDPKAAEQVTQSLSGLPDKQMWAAYGRLLFDERKVDQGIAEFERVLKEHDNAPELRNEYAILLSRAGRRKEAEAVLNGTLAKDPRDRIALLQRTTLEVDRGALDEASKDIRTLEGMKAFSAQLSYDKARVLLASHQSTKAGDMLVEALRLDPRMMAARLELARLLIASNNAKAALDVLDQANAPEKRSPDFLFNRNMALIAAGDWDGARKGVDTGLAAMRSPSFLYQDALLRMRSNDLAGAQKALTEGFALVPSDNNIVTLLGDVMRREGQSAKYLEMLKAAAAKNPQAATVQMALGRQLMAAGDRAGAAAAFNAARTEGNATDVETELAVLDIQSGALDSAKQRLTELVKTHDSAPARMLLAEIEARKGATPEASIQHYLKALQLDPQNVMAMNNMADFLSRENKFDDAQFWGQKALAAAPANPVVQDTMGWIYFREGKYEAALPLLEKSAHEADRPVAHYHLAGVLAKLGDAARGRKEYDLGVKQDPKSTARPAVSTLFEGGK